MASNDISFGKLLGYSLLAVVGLGIVGVAGSYMMTASSIVTAPGRVITRTMETNNIINNYEWFHDAHAQWRSRVAQIADLKRQVDSTTDDRAEKNRLNVDLGATRQSCRDLATRYNANAIKSNRSIFMGKEAPESLSMEACG